MTTSISSEVQDIRRNWTFVVISGKVQYRIWNSHQISKSNKKKLFKSVHKQGNWTFVVRERFEGKYNIGFEIFKSKYGQIIIAENLRYTVLTTLDKYRHILQNILCISNDIYMELCTL